MTCGNVRKLLSRYLDERAQAGERAEIDAHLATCAACGEELGLLRATGAALARAGRAEPPPDLAARAIQAAFSRGRSQRSPSLLERLFSFAWPMATASAAAALALMLAVGPGGTATRARDDTVAGLVSDREVGLDAPALVASVLVEEVD